MVCALAFVEKRFSLPSQNIMPHIVPRGQNSTTKPLESVKGFLLGQIGCEAVEADAKLLVKSSGQVSFRVHFHTVCSHRVH